MSNNPKKRTAEGEAPAKKKRRKAKPKFEDDELIDLELGVNGAVARMDSQLMADHLAQKTSRFGADLSSVELSDLSIPGKKQAKLLQCVPQLQSSIYGFTKHERPPLCFGEGVA